ncbi:Asp23/Gls24 family envelope stress response protein [Enterococcus olivae]
MEKQPHVPVVPEKDAIPAPELQRITGELTFDDKVIQKIIGIALEEIDGLLTVDGGFFSNLAEKLVNTDNVTSGISTEVGTRQVAVDMDVVVEYGKDIRQIFDKIKKVISREVGKMTHLEVIEVNVNIANIKSKKEYEEDSETVQDKVTGAANTAGGYISKQSTKARNSMNKGANEYPVRTEPRVQ